MSYGAFINSAQLLTTTFVCMLNFGILDSAVPVQARLSLVGYHCERSLGNLFKFA
jgi:hypothetical protein